MKIMSPKISLAALAAIGLSAAPACARTASAAPAGWDMIAFEMNSWGQPVSSWRITADGQGSWTETVREKAKAPMGDYQLAWHEFDAGKAGFSKLSAILAGLPNPAPTYEGCENAMTDMPYGTIRMKRGATTTEVSYNAGCLDDGYVKFLDTLRSANTLVEGWGKTAKVTRIEKP